MNKRYPAFDDCIHLERFTGCDYCAAKNLVAWASNKTHAISVKNLLDGSVITIENASTPCFSPDGETLFYLSSGQMHLCRPDGTDARPLSQFAGPVIDPIWSPDGQRILFGSAKSGSIGASADSAPAKHPGGPGNTPVVIEDFGYKFDGAGYIRPDSHTHLFVVEVATGEVIQLTHGVRDELHHTWMPDSQRVVYCGNENRPREQSIGYDLFTVDMQGNKKQISEGLWIVSYPNPIRPVVTPDGAAVIMGALNPYADSSLGYPDIVFFRFPVDGGAPALIFEKSDNCHQCVQFPYNASCGWGMDKVQITPDGKQVYFVSGFNGRGNVYKLALEGDDRHAVTVLDGQQVCHGLGRIQEGKMLLTMSRTDMPEAYYLLDTATDTITGPVVQSAQDMLNEVILTPAEDFTVPTADGESIIHGWVQPPVDLDPSKKYPAIVYVHGGPHPFYTYGLTMEHQCLAAEGFAVIYCNPRGSSSYGPQHQNIKRAYDGSAYQDLLTFADEAIRRFPWIDPDRLGVTGGSYGGYMTNYIATHDEGRFQCYITQRSVASDLISYASSDMQGSSRQFDSFEEFMLAKLKSSTVSYAEKINKPLLILHGEDDYRCPVEGAHQLFIAVKDTHPDLPVKLVIYPHTPHEQPAHPKLLKHYYQEMAAWFKKYL